MKVAALLSVTGLVAQALAYVAIPWYDPSSQSNPSARMEINDLANNQAQLVIFQLAMQRFQQQPDNSPTSYYQIAGIHGAPQ
jgi:hypothetical protein